MSRAIIIVTIAALLSLGGLFAFGFLRNCCSTRQAPGTIETAVARRLRSWSVPKAAASAPNPIANSPEVLRDASYHFADHCASCHGNDGSGYTEMGQHLYPRAPDMQLADTQQLSDGELYYIIKNGVRWTGMPAWGEPSDDQDSWKLVWFIRHLPNLTAEELRDMGRYNPKSAAEQQEEKEEQEFLQGLPAAPAQNTPHQEKQK